MSAAFSLSYRHLAMAPRQAFRRLGLHPGVDLNPAAAAALVGVTPPDADALLEELVDHHLVEQPAAARYRLHDLVRSFARDTALAEEPEPARRAALRRLLDHYLGTALAASELVDRQPRPLPVEAPAPAGPTPATAAGALDWFDRERPNLRAAVRLAAADGFAEQAWQLAMCLRPFHVLRGHTVDWMATHELGLAAAERLGHRAAEAALLNSLAGACSRAGRHGEAVDRLGRALAIYRDTGSRIGAGRTLSNLGCELDLLGRYDEAVESYRAATAELRAAGDRRSEAAVLNNLGVLLRQRGRYAEALDRHRQALAVMRAAADLTGECEVCNDTGVTLRAAGRHREALEHFRRALELARRAGEPYEQARALSGVAGLVDPAEAENAWREALALFSRLGVPEADEVRAALAAGARLSGG